MIAALITATLVNGTDCVGNPYMTTTVLSPRWTMSLCVKSDVPLCGISYRIEGAKVVSRVVFAPSDTTGDLLGDLGGTGLMSLPLVATFKMNLATPVVGVYKVRLADVSMVIGCEPHPFPTEYPIPTFFEVRRK
jgi:hypothetical protein